MHTHRSKRARSLIQALLTLATAASLTACGGREVELPTPEKAELAFPTTGTTTSTTLSTTTRSTPAPTPAPADDTVTSPGFVDLSLG